MGKSQPCGLTRPRAPAGTTRPDLSVVFGISAPIRFETGCNHLPRASISPEWGRRIILADYIHCRVGIPGSDRARTKV